jgi:hypothetical protein
LESRLIYKVSHSKYNIEWLNPTYDNGAWIYIGNGDETNKELILKCINEHFEDDHTLYISWTRNDSKEVPKADIESELSDILGNDFSIWNTAFTKVIELTHIGVMRLGKSK